VFIIVGVLAVSLPMGSAFGMQNSRDLCCLSHPNHRPFIMRKQKSQGITRPTTRQRVQSLDENLGTTIGPPTRVLQTCAMKRAPKWPIVAAAPTKVTRTPHSRTCPPLVVSFGIIKHIDGGKDNNNDDDDEDDCDKMNETNETTMTMTGVRPS
jgi:hypothetical protein